MSKKTDDTENGAAEAAPVFCAIEEHASALGITAPVFAAVRQYKGWAAGKKVEKSGFEKAVEDFLGSPIGGK
jgi:hypothetical protein